MKTLLWTLGVVTLVGLAVYAVPSRTIVEVPKTQVVEKEVEVETPYNRIKNAQDAKMSEIEASAQQAYQERKDQMLIEIELEVTRAYRGEIEAREAELEEQVSL